MYANLQKKILRQNTASMQSQQGNILITSLLVLLVLNLLAVGIMQVSLRMSKSATFKTIDSEVFQVADSCNDDVISWLQSQTAMPVTLPNFSTPNLNFMLTGDETKEMKNILSGYNYSCSLTPLLVQSSDSSTTPNIGEAVGGNDGYGATGDLSQRTYYKVTSTGGGPRNSVKIINTIISAEY